jgi:hypothetical protein
VEDDSGGLTQQDRPLLPSVMRQPGLLLCFKEL